jgi:precorrin-8X/cobalt-precorrin-8 methylmutase
MKPEEIEARSFAIIEEEAGDHGLSPDRWAVVRRMIHTTADFDYLRSVRFHPGAIAAGIEAIRRGKRIVTDTQMARAGIRKSYVHRFGGSVECLIAEPTVGRVAEEAETTRAMAAVDAAAPMIKGGIYVVGNAPTALLRLIELIRAGEAHPALVIGLPVGFVNAVESKEALTTVDLPYITNVGRKGGSNVAASVVNAIAIMAAQ